MEIVCWIVYGRDDWNFCKDGKMVDSVFER